MSDARAQSWDAVVELKKQLASLAGEVEAAACEAVEAASEDAA